MVVRIVIDEDGTQVALTADILANLGVDKMSLPQRIKVLESAKPSLGMGGPSPDDEPRAEAVPQKVTWQIVAKIDKQTNRKQWFLIGRRQPDLMRYARGKAIRAGMKAQLPDCWLN